MTSLPPGANLSTRDLQKFTCQKFTLSEIHMSEIHIVHEGPPEIHAYGHTLKGQ